MQNGLTHVPSSHSGCARPDPRHTRIGASVGVVGSLISLPVHLLLPHAQSVVLAGVIVAMIGAIYFGFAVQSGKVRDMVTEGLVSGLFLAIALAGIWGNAWIIPAGYALHGVWDIAHHRPARGALMAVQPWYPPFCAVYDWIFAIGLSAIWLAA